MSDNPFRPPVRETYEDQLDLLSGGKDGDLLEDVGLQSSMTTEQQHFLETQSSSVVSTGPIGPRATTNTTNIPTATLASDASSSSTPTFLASCCGFLSVDYYRPFFDVTTTIVLGRMKNSLLPNKADIFAETTESPPDLYGAVWISLTLVFLIGCTSNFNTYLAGADGAWEPDYQRLTVAVSTVFIYTFLIPLAIWGASLYFGVDPRPALIKMVAIYGYALTVFLPATILCSIPSSIAQWIILLLACGLSGLVLVRNLSNLLFQNYVPLAQDMELGGGSAPVIGGETHPSKRAYMLVLTAGCIHGVFALLLKLLFYEGAQTAATKPPA